MKRHLNKIFLSFCVFVTFILYYVTGATVAIPGTSTQFLASTVFPGTFEYLPQYPLDAWFFHGWALLFGEHLMTGMRLLTALIGAAIVGLLLRSAQLIILLAIREDLAVAGGGRDTAHFDYTLMKRLATMLLAPIAMMALPLWVMGSRPMEGHLTLLMLTFLLWLSLVLRSTYFEIIEREEDFTASVSVGLCVVFAFLSFTLFLSPRLVIALILPLCFAGRLFLFTHIPLEQRSKQLVWVGVGVLIGLLGALLVFTKGWVPTFLPNASGATSLFFVSFWQGLRSLSTALHAFESISAWVFYLLNVVLFIGCFPRAFYKALTPLIGQLSIVAMWVFIFAKWPEAFWMSLIEPSPIVAMGMVLFVINTMLLIASWVRNWLDANLERPTKVKVLYSTLLTVVPAGLLFGSSLFFFKQDASCSLANEALEAAWQEVEPALPASECPWLNPPKGSESILIQRYVDQKPLIPITHPVQQLDKLKLNGKDWATATREDVLLAEFASIGEAPLVQYLTYSDWGTALFEADPFASQYETLVRWAEYLSTTDFAQTTLGARTIKDAYRLVAIYLANAALEMPAEEALAMLRKAAKYDPENKGIALSIASLANEGQDVTEEELNRATTIYSELPYLENPTLAELERVEKLYGAIRTPPFATAHRLAHFNAGVENESCLENLIHLYKTTPHVLSLEERLYVLLHLTKEEAYPIVQRENRLPDPLRKKEEVLLFRELEAFLLLHIYSPEAMQLYETRQHLFGNSKTSYISQLYRVKKTSASFGILSEKIVTFYHRDKHIAYALYYVRYLLEAGRLQEATDFLTAFDVREALAKQPLFNQYLLRTLAEAWLKVDAGKAHQLLNTWLSADPKQPHLWTFYLRQLNDDDIRQTAVRECLRSYPMHPVATRLFFESCITQYGQAIAQRYLDSVNAAQKNNTRTAPHAHR